MSESAGGGNIPQQQQQQQQQPYMEVPAGIPMEMPPNFYPGMPPIPGLGFPPVGPPFPQQPTGLDGKYFSNSFKNSKLTL